MTHSQSNKWRLGSSNRTSPDAHPHLNEPGQLSPIATVSLEVNPDHPHPNSTSPDSSTALPVPNPTSILSTSLPPIPADHAQLLDACFRHYYAPYPRPPQKKSVMDTLQDVIAWVPHSEQKVVREYEPPVLAILKSVFNGVFVRESKGIKNESTISEAERPPTTPSFQINSDLQTFLVGRLLQLSECQSFSLEELKCHAMYHQIKVLPGITYRNGRPWCQRCENHTPYRFAEHKCERCGQECLYCRECLEMGQIRECSILLKWIGPAPDLASASVQCQWEGTLTPEQKRVSDKLLQAVQHQEDFLSWAVCGAGKTEVLYETIQTLIREGKRVAIAAPRTDVILELDGRMTNVFPDVPRVSLYADTPVPYTYTPFVLTTLHQLRRFDAAFDLIIIDEVDAFPFNGNRALEHVLGRAIKPNGSRVFVTATPTRTMKRSYLKGLLKGAHLPIRFHRAPLPEPRFIWAGNWLAQIKKNKLPSSLTKWLGEAMENERRVFLFVPEIQLVERVTTLLKEKGFSVEGSHSKDPNRREKVLAFREGVHRIMVTTTILERGVTIPFADVAVLGAENTLYDERALVQMAGRSGRSAQNPSGDVLFFHYGKTLEMLKARAHIRFMNQEALRLRGER